MLISNFLFLKNIEYNYTATTGQSEIQEIVIQSLGVDSPFVLQFDGVTTSLSLLKIN